ncbi:hypothetical protein JHK87_006666 [Glycine soja]|nr:hypothetical protein JHK87_006666 [Glycine soja]
MKATRFTHLNLEGTECRIVYNHHRKTTKIGNGWRTFVQTQNLLPGTQIIFELQDATSNFDKAERERECEGFHDIHGIKFLFSSYE